MTKPLGIAVATALVAGMTAAQAASLQSAELPQLSGDTAATGNGWITTPLLTIGKIKPNGPGTADDEDTNLEELGVRPVGLLDGLGAFRWGSNTVRILANHELNAEVGYAYQLANGTALTGSRISFFDVNAKTRLVTGSGPAYTRIFDRAGQEVSDPAQIHEGNTSGSQDGFDRFCSAYGVEAGKGGLMDDIFFSGEETSEFGDTVEAGFGGQETALDVNNQTLYVVPMLGRAAFENVHTVEPGSSNKVVLVIGDDRQGAPLYLYIGEKGRKPAAGPYNPPAFLVRNGLGLGNLYAWVADNGDKSPEDFNGTFNSRTGKFVRIKHFDPSLANTPGYDSLGFASLKLQDQHAGALGAFRFSRPEDVTANPKDETQVVLASTGRGSLFPSDNWGTTYLIDIDFVGKLAKALDDPDLDNIKADVSILYDGDDAGGGQFANPDEGLRSPDNLDWANDGFIYAQEDRSVSPGSSFGAVSGAEASVWQLDPATGKLVRILEIDRSAVPAGQGDPEPFDIGNWESSGVLDVSEHFDTAPGETLLVLDVQAHSLQGGGLAKEANQPQDLVEGGQLLLASGKAGTGNDLMLTKEANVGTAGVGQRITYTLLVRNNGSQTSTGAKIIDTLPAGVSFVSASSGCRLAGNTVTCTLPRITSGQRISRIIQVRPTASGELRNTAIVSANEADPNRGNNTATAVVTVQ